MRRVYGKLVRDLVPAIMVLNGAVPRVRCLNDEEYLLALRDKAVEEAQELVAAQNREQILQELVDLSEVIQALCRAYGFSVEELEATRQRKRQERGGFDGKFFLESADEP
ncbi:MAG: nucleoside triphosphate pyrophosphohydrolase [Patescibacteria group bacterium]